MEVVEAEEEHVRQEEEAEKERRRNREAHARAGVLALDDGSLLTRMFRGDKDMGVLLQLPGAHALMSKCVYVCVCGRSHSFNINSTHYNASVWVGGSYLRTGNS